jgi:23S rRNA pseudouridine2605 synthase
MRINKYIAQSTGLGRRAADMAIEEGRVAINGQPTSLGANVTDKDNVTFDGRTITPPVNTITIMLNKPAGYVSSRNGQGSQTVYDLLPAELHHLKPVGRLDKDSSGLLLLTNDGQLANELTHPRYDKEKVYEVALDEPLADTDLAKLNQGLVLEDGVSKLEVSPIKYRAAYLVRMREGRNRQIRRTFNAIGYTVTRLHRTQFGPYKLGDLSTANYAPLGPKDRR